MNLSPDQEQRRFEIAEGISAAGLSRFSHAAMATLFEVICAHPDRRYAGQAAQEVFGLVDRLEKELSRFIENSDISRINSSAPGVPVRVGPWTLECLEIAQRAFVETGGAFDVSVGSGFHHVELAPDTFTVTVHADCVRLDLGGIGKGYALDRAADLLAEWGIERAIVHGGFSSVLALEPPPDLDGWPLTLSMPGVADRRTLTRIAARRQAFSGSGIQKKDHITDPRNMLAVRGRRAAWVSVDCLALPAPDPATGSGGGSAGAIADALSTAFMILPQEEIEDCCRRFPGLQVWLIPEPAGERPEEPDFLHFCGPGPPGRAGDPQRVSPVKRFGP